MFYNIRLSILFTLLAHLVRFVLVGTFALNSVIGLSVVYFLFYMAFFTAMDYFKKKE